VSEAFGLGRLSGRQLALLWLILSAGLLLRLIALDWGLPPSGPERAAAGLRSSYAIDEAKILEALSQTDPAALDLDPGLYHWGTLHLNLTLGALETANAAGFFGEPWREAWRGMHSGGFERVYVTGRLLSVAVDMLSVVLAALIALRLAGVETALWTAALVALSPGHVLQSGQIRVDVTATACLLAVCLGVLANWGPFRLGLIAGLATAAKYSMFPLALAALAVEAAYRGWAPRRLALIAGGAAAGFLLGEPWLLTNGAEVVRQVGGLIALSRETPPEVQLSVPVLLGESLAGFARFSTGWPAALLGAWGLALLWRRGGLEGRLLPVVFTAGLLALIPQNWPLLRYSLPLTAICAVGAGVAIVSGRKWGGLLGAGAAFVAASACFSIVSYRIAPHTANMALRMLERAAKPGETVSRIMPELPPLSPAAYPAGPNPLMEDLAAAPPDWVVLTDFPVIDYPEANQQVLEKIYERTAVFQRHARSSWATLGEGGAPQDWKYTRPEVTIYRKR
jgi:hypothetical protein